MARIQGAGELIPVVAFFLEANRFTTFVAVRGNETGVDGVPPVEVGHDFSLVT
ncbi:MAG: hypothetical protein AAB473_02595 [Patescibacteria group bacterium]